MNKTHFCPHCIINALTNHFREKGYPTQRTHKTINILKKQKNQLTKPHPKEYFPVLVSLELQGANLVGHWYEHTHELDHQPTPIPITIDLNDPQALDHIEQAIFMANAATNQ
jgi:hypothetical protein